MKRIFFVMLAAGLFASVGTLFAAEPAGDATLALDAKLPLAPETVTGELKNGLTYYIRKNTRPSNRAELRLVVNAGSVLETEEERGVAHFVEHMAFNGTKHFKEHELIDFMESIGMQFGPEVNAYTSFDETVYMLQVPTDTTGVVEKAFQILEDWAHLISFDPVEIDKERGVITEEWRLGRGANMRMVDKYLPVLLKDSRYAERLAIGKKEIIETAPPSVISGFYKKWYRPENMAVVAVGDFDPAKIEKLIRKQFSGIKSAKDAPERVYFPVPDHAEPLFSIVSDPEATANAVQVMYTRAVEEEKTVADSRRGIVEALYNGMLNARFSDLSRRADPPFLSAGSGSGHFVRTKDGYSLGASVRDNGIERGLEALLTEAARVKRYGFTQSELDRQKASLLRNMESRYAEREKTESRSIAGEYVSYFLQGEPVPGVAYEYELYKKYVPGISLDEVNKLADTFVTTGNRVVIAALPEKAGVSIPTVDDLRAVFDRVERADVAAWSDDVPEGPLVEHIPATSPVITEKRIPELGITQWTFANGARVVLKPTDFKRDQVLFGAFSQGGRSLVADSNYLSATFATSIMQESGVGRFSRTALSKKLAGKIVSMSPWLSDLQESFSGTASPKDLETMFQLAYLYFTEPRTDSTAFAAFIDRQKASLANRSASPENAFSDTLSATMGKYNFRALPLTSERLAKVDLGTAFRVYRERFGDPGDFTFFIVGNFDSTMIRPMVETWIGGLPSIPRTETWRDLGIRPPDGVVKKTLHQGIEPKSRTRIEFIAPFEWSTRTQQVLRMLADVLNIRLREVVREDMGGTYGVSVYGYGDYVTKQSRVSIGFGAKPERLDDLVKSVFAELDSIKANGPGTERLEKVRETQLRGREIALKENGFWLGALMDAYFRGNDPREMLGYEQLVRSVTEEDIRQAARMYLNENNYVRIDLYPEEKAENTGK